MKRIWMAAALALLAACGDSSSTSISGTWVEKETLPGAKLILVLRDDSGTVSGVGSYTIEAGRTGTLNVTGTFHDPDVSLALVYDFGDTVAFTGTLKTATQMVGTFGGGDAQVEFDKQ
jgi:hypothetical protein